MRATIGLRRASRRRRVAIGGAVAALAVAALALAQPAHATLSFTRVDYAVGTAPSGVAAGALDQNDFGVGTFVAVANEGSDTVTVLRNVDPAVGLVAAQGPIPVGDAPSAIAAGTSLVGDTLTDLVVVYRGSPDGIAVLRGENTDTFSVDPLALITGTNPSAVAVCDITFDGQPDIVVANEGSSTVTIHLNGGGSPWTTQTVALAPGSQPKGITCEDTGEVFTADAGTSTVTRIVATAGVFGVDAVTQLPPGAAPSALTLMWDKAPGVQHVFLAVANAGSGTASLFQAQPPPFTALAGSPFTLGAAPSDVTWGPMAGSFEPTTDFPFSFFPTSGFFDLAFSNRASDEVTLLLGDGYGTFQRALGTFPVGDQPSGIAQSDLDLNGIDGDLAVANAGSNTVSILVNQRLAGVAVAPSAIAFPEVPSLTLSPAQTVTLTNTGGRQVEVTGASISGPHAADFLVSSNSCSRVPAGRDASCTVQVRFAPSAAGPRAATLRMTVDQIHGTVFEVPLSGSGGALPTGPQGLPGPAGPQGLPGVTASGTSRLAAALADSRLTARRGRTFRARFVVTHAAAVTVQILRGTKRVRAVSTRTLKAGRASVALKIAVPGRYVLRLAVRTPDGQVARDQIPLAVT